MQHEIITKVLNDPYTGRPAITPLTICLSSGDDGQRSQGPVWWGTCRGKRCHFEPADELQVRTLFIMRRKGCFGRLFWRKNSNKSLTFFLFFSGSDPNQHILDTLEQCISVIIEKIQHLDNLQQQQQMEDKNSSRMSSLDYARVNDGETNEMRVGET